MIPAPGDGSQQTPPPLAVTADPTPLAQTQLESASQSPVPGQLPISQLIIPTVAMLNDPMMAQWTAPATPPGLPLYTEPRLIPPGTDASHPYPETHSDRVAFSEAFQPLLDVCCESQVFLLREKSLSPPTEAELHALIEAMAGNRHTHDLVLANMECPRLLDLLAKVLARNTSVHGLYLPRSCGAGSGAALAEALGIHPTLRELDLGKLANEEGMVAALSGAMGSAARLTCVKLDLDAFRPKSHVGANEDHDKAQERQPRKASVAEIFDALEKDIEQAAAINHANQRQLPAATQGMAMMLGLQANGADALPELPLDITRALTTAAVRHTRPDDAKRIIDTLSSYAPREKEKKE